ncbi:unnamed protein product, partial [Effrenium voratum]
MNFTQVTDALSCTAALAGLSKQDLARLSMSTGKSLPKDAGKFIACSGIPGAHYLLATMSGTLSSSSPGVPFGLGLCLPEACGDADVPAILNSPLALQLIPDLSAFSLSNFHVTDPVAGLIQPGALCWVAVATLALLGAAIAFSTLRMCRARVETSQLSGAPPRAPPLLNQAFALVGRNGTMTKLMECPPPKPTDCLNGLRVLAMAWIILGHTFLMPEGVSGYSNSQDITMSAWNKAAAERSPWLMLIIQAEQSVDTFFFLSGFLLSHLMLKELQSRGASPVLAILLRYFRLTPSLALVMLVYYGILPYLASGPFAVILQDSIFRRCNGSWWSELTYTMNFIPFDSDKVCMGWTWYLGDDMIFFVLGSVLVPLYHRRRILGWFLMLCVTGLSLGVTAWLIAKYHLSAYIFDSHYARYSYYAYSKPYTRAPAYFVGVRLGRNCGALRPSGHVSTLLRAEWQAACRRLGQQLTKRAEKVFITEAARTGPLIGKFALDPQSGSGDGAQHGQSIVQMFEAGEERWSALLGGWLVMAGVLRYKHGKQKKLRQEFSFMIPSTFLSGFPWAEFFEAWKALPR